MSKLSSMARNRQRLKLYCSYRMQNSISFQFYLLSTHLNETDGFLNWPLRYLLLMLLSVTNNPNMWSGRLKVKEKKGNWSKTLQLLSVSVTLCEKKKLNELLHNRFSRQVNDTRVSIDDIQRLRNMCVCDCLCNDLSALVMVENRSVYVLRNNFL